jgi:deoxyhypusine synthase
MPRLVDWFLGRLNNKEAIDLLHLHSSNNNLAQGQMCDKLHQKAATIAVLIAGVQIISSGIVHGLRNLIKGKALTKVIRTRVKSP